MRDKIHGIYVAGLGDHRRPLERKFGTLWLKRHGVILEDHPMRWGNGEPLGPKLEGLSNHIDALHQQFGEIVLLGSSAGFGAVLNAYARHPDQISSVVGLCGKVYNPQTVAHRFRQNPAFEESLAMLPATLGDLEQAGLLDNVLSLRPFSDHIVDPQDTIIPNAHSDVLHMRGHALSIVWGLTAESSKAADFMHRQAT